MECKNEQNGIVPALVNKNWKRQNLTTKIKSRAVRRLVGILTEEDKTQITKAKKVATRKNKSFKIKNNNIIRNEEHEDEDINNGKLLTKLFLDCYNTFDLDLLKELLALHCTHDVIQTHHYDGEKNPCGPDFIEVRNSLD